MSSDIVQWLGSNWVTFHVTGFSCIAWLVVFNDTRNPLALAVAVLSAIGFACSIYVISDGFK